MWSTLARWTTIRPTTQTIALVVQALPHSWLRMAETDGAMSSRTQIARLVGFQRCRPRQRSTYLDEIAIAAPRAKGHSTSWGLSRMTMLLPEM